MKVSVFAVVAALALGASAASATSYDIAGSFAALPATTAPFSYGYSNGGVFTAYDVATSNCAGINGLACDYSSTYNNNTLPAVGINTTGANIASGTVVIPTNMLFLHPVGDNSGLAAGDTIVRFTAPTSSLYKLSGLFSVLDVSTSGVNVSIIGPSGNAILAAYGLGGAWGTSKSFDSSVSLSAGQTLDFVVNSNGSYYNDSTGLSGTIAAVPEPASWAMMVGGFGVVGAAVRRRQRTAVAFA
jgi:hypothetical protein